MINKHYQYDFGIQTPLYLLDGARVRIDQSPGLLYQHGLVKDNFIIIELANRPFFALAKRKKFRLSLESEDEGLFAFPEIAFVKQKIKQSFVDKGSKTVQFEVPDYDNFSVRVRVRGAGQTRLLSLHADLIE